MTARNARFVRRRAVTLAAVGVAAASVAACTAAGPEDAIDARFGDIAGEAKAIADCESHMNPNAVSRTNDHGLFQINIVHRGSFEQVTGQSWSEVYSSFWNAEYARWLYDRAGWAPWSCRWVVGA
jgi:hypothetical protein